MRLTQSIYNITADTAIPIESPSVSNPPGTTARSLNYCFAIKGIDINIKQSTPPPSTTSTATFPSPAIKLRMPSYNKSQQTAKSYRGGMTFLNNQEEFNINFASSPTILPSNLMSPNYLSTQKLQR